MQGETLTPYRREFLYDLASKWGSGDPDETDGDADDALLLLHALAETPDGPLEVREDYLLDDVVPQDKRTPQEIVSGWIEFYGAPETDPYGPVTITVRVRAYLPSEDERDRFDEDDLFEAVAATLHEVFPIGRRGEPYDPPVVPVVTLVV